MAAAAACESHQAVLENAAALVLLELAHDEAGQASLFLDLFQEVRPVRLDDLVQDAFFGPAALVAVRALAG